MFAFRSAIRKLFGIIIPGVDKAEVDVVTELRAALEEAEAEIKLLQVDNFVLELSREFLQEAALEALVSLASGLGADIVIKESDEDFPNNVVDSY